MEDQKESKESTYEWLPAGCELLAGYHYELFAFKAEL